MGIFLMKPFFMLFTNDPLVLQYGITYGSIVITFTFGSIIHITIEKMFHELLDIKAGVSNENTEWIDVKDNAMEIRQVIKNV